MNTIIFVEPFIFDALMDLMKQTNEIAREAAVWVFALLIEVPELQVVQ